LVPVEAQPRRFPKSFRRSHAVPLQQPGPAAVRAAQAQRPAAGVEQRLHQVAEARRLQHAVAAEHHRHQVLLMRWY
jgi:hypothetical protein